MVEFSYTDILALVLTSLSLVLTSSTVIIHLILKELLHHPGHLVFLQCIFQFITDIH